MVFLLISMYVVKVWVLGVNCYFVFLYWILLMVFIFDIIIIYIKMGGSDLLLWIICIFYLRGVMFFVSN